MNDCLKISQEGRVRRLTLNRPAMRHALNLELCQALLAALKEADEDRNVGAILLNGAGKIFCSGMDLKEVLEADAEAMLPVHQELFSVGTRLRTPMVSLVHGAAIAGGMGLALNGHWVIAAAGTKFGITEVRIGLWPFAIFEIMVRAVGERQATQLALEAKVFDSERAGALGLVDEVVAADSLDDRCVELAEGLASLSGEAVRHGLEFVPRLLGGDPNAVVDGRRNCQATADFKEGILAFREKRAPEWPSHA